MSIRDLVCPAIANLPPYVAGRTIAQASADNGGIAMVKMGSNENPLGPSPKAVAAMQKAVSDCNFYPDPTANPLRERIADYHGIAMDRVVAANGSSRLIQMIAEVFLTPGDEMITCMPTFFMYIAAAMGMDAVPVSLPLDANGYFDLDAIKAAITEKTKMIVICNPNNPTSTHLDGDQLEAFLRALPKNIICVVDEAYIEFADDPTCKSMIHLVDETNVIVLRTFSKIWGLSGARAGYSIANPEITYYLLNKYLTFNVNGIVMDGAMASLNDQAYLKLAYNTNLEGRKYLTKELTAMGWRVAPSQTNFVYVDCGYNPAKFAQKLEAKGYIIRGNFEQLRITVGTMEQNIGLMSAIKAVVAEWAED